MNRQEKDARLTRLIQDINFYSERVSFVSADEELGVRSIYLDCDIDAREELEDAVKKVGGEVAGYEVTIRLKDDASYEERFNRLTDEMLKEFKDIREMINDADNESKYIDIMHRYGNTMATLEDLLEKVGVNVYE